MTNKPGRGRPTRYTSKLPANVTTYTKDCLSNDVFPTIEGLATHLGVGTRTIYDWEAEYPDFSQTIDQLRDTQRQLLITNGLTGSYNTRFAMFLLKANHGMSEKDPLITATQNSYMNISPDLLADALEIMQNKSDEE
ncbi:MAG: hypothetical protein COV78_04835 [Candidatus Pacebacteria bacterium CG11_big_fil_rev_8_21_14_0_20_34_55]|nr:MAG: hypothetical protein COV78_04835 [Candidatus Pacebacteria bacterium CG11_big_fil_rev_8_21_14_0_20_34_55]